MIINVPSLTSSALDSGFQVGDILETARVDLGNDWLECDGSEIDKDETPELWSVMNEVPLQNKSYEEKSTVPLYSLNRVVYENGYYIALGLAANRTSGFAYATSLEGPWTVVTRVYSKNTTGCHDIIYGKGYWILEDYGSYYYAANLNGTWTEMTGGCTNGTLRSLAFNNNYFYCYNSSGVRKISSITDTWTIIVSWKDITEVNSNFSSCLLQYNNTYNRWELMGALLSTENSARTYTFQMMYSADLETWVLGPQFVWSQSGDTAVYGAYMQLSSDGLCWLISAYTYYGNMGLYELYPNGEAKQLALSGSMDNRITSFGPIGGNGDLVEGIYVRQKAGEDFVSAEKYNKMTNLGRMAWENNELIFFKGLVVGTLGNVYLKYRPDITTTDTNAFTKLYIKAK